MPLSIFTSEIKSSARGRVLAQTEQTELGAGRSPFQRLNVNPFLSIHGDMTPVLLFHAISRSRGERLEKERERERCQRRKAHKGPAFLRATKLRARPPPYPLRVDPPASRSNLRVIACDEKQKLHRNPPSRGGRERFPFDERKKGARKHVASR